MLIENKIRIYKSCIRPILTYAIETTADTPKTKQKQRTTEMKTLGKICGYTLTDKKHSNDIRNICGIQNIVRWSRYRRRYWKDHVNKMEEDQLAKVAMNGQINAKHQPGKPPKRWCRGSSL
ncbi:uncharacterized protein LOC129613079 [Condylostylus longicornis]|uniref:uncharacterized protein LOC129613079 n=1 Tax=Condylostylus longicornis TaxID=2530218 RepID=UPI00244E0C8F|nr:uncharacterized protein LOC129613079 [Condylostylus longicornis]